MLSVDVYYHSQGMCYTKKNFCGGGGRKIRPLFWRAALSDCEVFFFFCKKHLLAFDRQAQVLPSLLLNPSIPCLPRVTASHLWLLTSAQCLRIFTQDMLWSGLLCRIPDWLSRLISLGWLNF